MPCTSHQRHMFVIKRDGSEQAVQLDKITARIEQLCRGPGDVLQRVDPVLISTKVVAGLYAGVTTVELDKLAVETAAALTTKDPQYNQLAARIAISDLQKQTPDKFSEAIKQLHEYEHPLTKAKGVIDPALHEVVAANTERLDAAIKPDRDYNYSLFGFKTLERAYLLKCDGKIVERPGYMLMRVALGIHGADLDAALQTYHDMSQQLYTHATPTLFNAGTKRAQMSSCFLLDMEDSIEGIYKTLSDSAFISKNSGGIGINIHDIRASGSHIAGTGGTSNGIVPLLRVFNDSARFVDQGGGKRPGSLAFYLEPHHADIMAFLDLRKNSGDELQRARDLFTAVWVSDVFMERVQAEQDWSLMCPHECPGLSDVYGDDYRHLYETYEREGRARKTVPAQQVWAAIVASMTECGTPYICSKDSVNRKSGQANIGTIKSSNLCAEVTLFTSPEEISVCNLASINVAYFANAANKSYDFQGLANAASRITVNLNHVIDKNYYPVPETRNSNLKHRPIGVGVQGLADTFFKLRLPFENEKALQLSCDIAEAIYYGCARESIALAKRDGPYSSYAGSPASRGQLQFHLWEVQPSSGNFDWTVLLADLKQHGMRNSTLTCQMPTASTSAILGKTESVEALCSNCYVRRTGSGEYILLNEYLVNDLIEHDLWSADLVNQLIADGGSVQQLDIPQELKQLYRTTWQIKQRAVIDQAAARGPYLDMSQSMNLFIAEPSLGRISSAIFYSWKKGLKTLCYYLRSRPKADATQFTVDRQAADKSRTAAAARNEAISCTRAQSEAGGCEACSA